MILKGSSRSNTADLATHLMNGYDNERAELAEVRGTVSGDLHGAFAEIELIASGTRAQKPLFSLSINPHEALTREQYFEAIDAIEKRLGFEGQPRFVVFHEKDGREHAHVVWSRIDTAEMKAIRDSFYKAKLCDMAVILAEKFGHDLPEGLKAWKEKNRKFDDKLEPTLGETANEKKTGISAEQRREEITSAYTQADSASAFVNALEEKGYVLAKGDSRAFVIVDKFGDVHSLSRYIKGVRAMEIKARLASLNMAALPSVAQAQEQAKARLAAQEERAREQKDLPHDHHADDHGRDQQAQEKRGDDRHADDERIKRTIDQKRAAMDARQRERRLEFVQAEQQVLTQHQDEKLALDAAQKAESTGLFFRMRARVADLIDERPALRSVLGHITERAGLDPRERHRLEQQALARRHARERNALDSRKRSIEKIEKREYASLERDLKREALRRMMAQERQREEARRQDLRDDLLLTDPHLLEEGGFRDEFNMEAAGDHHHDEDGDGGDEDGGLKKKRTWKERSKGKGTKRKGGRGYGYRRD